MRGATPRQHAEHEQCTFATVRTAGVGSLACLEDTGAQTHPLLCASNNIKGVDRVWVWVRAGARSPLALFFPLFFPLFFLEPFFLEPFFFPMVGHPRRRRRGEEESFLQRP